VEPVTAYAMTGALASGDSRSVLLGSQFFTPVGVVDSLNIHTPTNFGDPRRQSTIQPMIKCTVRNIVILKPTLKWPHVLLADDFSRMFAGLHFHGLYPLHHRAAQCKSMLLPPIFLLVLLFQQIDIALKNQCFR
jgi:hypothetical protein